LNFAQIILNTGVVKLENTVTLDSVRDARLLRGQEPVSKMRFH